MGMDFKNDNMKILYVSHMIDQGLTRPDILAQYYCNNYNIKNISSNDRNNINNSKQQENQDNTNANENEDEKEKKDDKKDDCNSNDNFNKNEEKHDQDNDLALKIGSDMDVDVAKNINKQKSSVSNNNDNDNNDCQQEECLRMQLKNNLSMKHQDKLLLSCHQCKNVESLNDIEICGHIIKNEENKTIKVCTKKYCHACLLRFYLNIAPDETNEKENNWQYWKCPKCCYICCCAWCRRNGDKKFTDQMLKQIDKEANRLTPAVTLARRLVKENKNT